MIDVRLYFRVRGKRDEICDIDRNWYSTVKGTVFCPQCDGLLDASDCPQLTLRSFHHKEHLMYVPGCAFGIISAALLHILDDHGFRDQHCIGHLQIESKVSDSHFAFHPRDRVVIRGGPTSTFRYCSACSRLLYSPQGNCYVTESSVASRSPLYGVGGGAVLVSGAVWQELKESTEVSRYLKADKIVVKGSALDALAMP